MCNMVLVKTGDLAVTMFERTLFHVLRVIVQDHAARWSARVPDITKPQFAVMEALHQKQEMDQVSLGRASATTKATLTEMLSRMERRGLIERRVDPSDARQKLVRLTVEGTRRLEQLRPVADQIHDDFTATLSPQERDTLLDLLSKLLKRVDGQD